MTQEKPPRWGKPVLLRGKLLLLIVKHLEITFAEENKIHNRNNLSLFPRQNFLRNRANQPPQNLSQAYSEIPYAVQISTVWTALYGPRFLCRMYESIRPYGFNKCCKVASIFVLYGYLDFHADFSSISMQKIRTVQTGYGCNKCWYLPLFPCPPLHENPCHSFLEMIFFLLSNLLSLQRMFVCVFSQWTHERHLMVSFPS
jgi:hypothetical protein